VTTPGSSWGDRRRLHPRRAVRVSIADGNAQFRQVASASGELPASSKAACASRAQLSSWTVLVVTDDRRERDISNTFSVYRH
jgi:hypothetical protein